MLYYKPDKKLLFVVVVTIAIYELLKKWEEMDYFYVVTISEDTERVQCCISRKVKMNNYL